MSVPAYPAPTTQPFSEPTFSGDDEALADLLDDMVDAGPGATGSRTYATLYTVAVERGLIEVAGR